MRHLFVCFSLLAALLTAMPATAQYEDGRRGQRYERDDGRRGPQRYERYNRGEPRDVQRRSRRETLSPDERRQLRRDIEDYGRDIYRGRGGRSR